MKKILIIEDDETIRTELAELLEVSGYTPIILTSFKQSEEEILRENLDCQHFFRQFL